MKDILKMMRFDFISATGTAGTDNGAVNTIMLIFMLVLLLAGALLVTPFFAFCFVFSAGSFIVPLQSAKNEDLGRLYGVLPVERKNITRARFLYIFLAHLVTGVLSFLLGFTSLTLDLHRFLATDSDVMKKFAEMFDPEVFGNLIPIITGFIVFSCVTFAFMEMIGQIQGRQSEMKVLFILIIAVCVIIVGGVFILGQLGYPEIKLPDLPWWLGYPLVAAGALGVCVLFGEITATKLAKREL